jgi:hypothetical protein
MMPADGIENILAHGAARAMRGQVHSLHGKKASDGCRVRRREGPSFRISNVISQKADETITWLRYRHRTH